MRGARLTPERLQVIDSHTGGEPTRVVIGGGPDLGRGTMAERRARFQADFDRYRSAVANEPRGSDPVVGAWLCAPAMPECVTGVIFFNNVGYLGMCGHGAIGVVTTLAHVGRLAPGAHRLDTPVGVVDATLEGDGRVSIDNVLSYRTQVATVRVEGLGDVTGDVAWGGNWFFLVRTPQLELSLARAGELSAITLRIRAALTAAGITGDDGGEIDHVELFGPASSDAADSRNFVMCPGGAYDRSPCGTGTSAKLACLYADGVLAEGRVWRQESLVGSVFDGWVRAEGRGVRPTIRGQAFVTGESTLLLDPRDPLCWGIR